MTMDAEPDKPALERHREALKSLSRRELQARAKALGVRANGKSVDIIESVAKALSRPGSPGKEANADKQGEKNPENYARLDEACVSSKLPQAAGDELLTSISCSAIHPATSSTPGPVTEGPLKDLAAPALTDALAASLDNLHFMLPMQAAGFRFAQASLRRSVQHLRYSESMRGSVDMSQGKSSSFGCEQDELTTTDTTAEEQPRVNALVNDAALVRDALLLQESTRRRRVLAGNCQDDAIRRSLSRIPTREFTAAPASKFFGNAVTRSADTENSGKVSADAVSPAAVLVSRQSPGPSGGTNHDVETCHPSSPPLALTTQHTSAVPPGAAGAAAATPMVVRHVAGPVRAPGLFVTDRTPLRQQNLMNSQLQALGAATLTPAARGAPPPRTPGTGLRTPARRVAVCTDEAKERAMDEWVAQNLVTAAGSLAAPAGVSWGELVGLRHAKQRLEAICMNNFATPEASSPFSETQVRAASTTAAGVGKSTILSKLIGGPVAHGQTRAARPGNLPNTAVLLCGPSGIGKSHLVRALASELGAAYVHVPSDLSSRVAQAPGGAEIVMRSISRVAMQLPGPVVVHIEDVDRLAGVDVTRQRQDCRRLRTELVVAVDELVLQPLSQLPTPGQSCTMAVAIGGRGGASPASSSGRSPPAAEVRARTGGNSNGASKARFKVLVLTTTSRPMDLDVSLASSLGRTERILETLPGPEDRELYLVARLAAEGAALGVTQVECLVRQTEGLTCAQIAALCDCARTTEAARRATSYSHGPVFVTEEDIMSVLQHMERQCTEEDLAKLEEWHMRPSGVVQYHNGPLRI
ncbi:hypothetical protein VaNZ11_014161 [Volvox africanus]|uniref:AAA+ ATPase domain-containing protein n=1 Tax=Volvox africanus TaxID=51714 RepID=A0ABQ5SIQ1_9CHLO|nr:hypothetical protein VaNZ11_014161 [Volvox africanus]